MTWHPLLPDLAAGRSRAPDRGTLDAGGGLSLLLRQAREHGVEYAVTRSLLRPGWSGLLADHESTALREVQAGVVRQGLVWERLAREALTLLAGGSPPILLKGAGARAVLYEDPAERHSVDLDLMIPEDSEREALKALEAGGWCDEVSRPSPRWHVHAMWKEGPLGGLSVEVHRTLDNPERSAIGYALLAPLCRRVETLGRVCLVPEAPAQLIVAATHALRHGLDLPLKSLVDVHLGVEACLRSGGGRWTGDPGPDPVARAGALLARAPGTAATLGVLLDLSRSLFGTSLPPGWQADLAPPRWTAPLLSASVDHGMPGFARRAVAKSPRRRRLWFQLLLTGSPAVLTRVAWGWARRRWER
ncbi:MAG: nucleotidyltransferase family protein [Deltaproteobacteria bacterium]|nr:nucleotidyltransferase family protein [Deltaproteobacteria bacterium]